VREHYSHGKESGNRYDLRLAWCCVAWK